jgi:GrpB-like predicted nucleotidyltransferase (UPF0157 family)
MKIILEPYNANWVTLFQELKIELEQSLQNLSPVIEHIGSTSVPGLSAKPIIDILIGIQCPGDLDKAIEPLLSNGYVFYQKYNREMPYRRFFVKLKDVPESAPVPSIIFDYNAIPNEVNVNRLANIHVVEYNTYHWKRHIAFREYLKQHESAKAEYQALKLQLSSFEWADFNEYNSGKDSFIKQTEQKAIEWLNQASYF